MQKIAKPQAGEYAPYAIDYIRRVPDDGRVLDYLAENLKMMTDFVRSLPSERLDQPCAPGEWTVKEVLVHIIDCERIFAYRALRVARRDSTELPGFDQDAYTPHSGANARSLDSILEEYAAVRQASITLFKNLPEDVFALSGIANNNPFSVRAALYQIAGHELHHYESLKANYGQ